MYSYIVGLTLLAIGFLIPPIGGYEQIFIIVGAFIVFKEIRKNKNG